MAELSQLIGPGPSRTIRSSKIGWAASVSSIACTGFALLLPAVCAIRAAQCKSAVETVKVKFEASEEADTHLLVEKLNEHGCGHGLAFEPAGQGFVYRILLVNTTEARPTFSMAGVGTAHDPVILIT